MKVDIIAVVAGGQCSCSQDLGRHEKRSRPKLVQGSSRNLVVRFISNDCLPDSFQVSSASEIRAALLNADGSTQIYSLSSTGGAGGGAGSSISFPGGSTDKVQIALTAAGTALLAPTDCDLESPFPGVELELTIGGAITRINLPGTLDVQSPLFPSMV